jgi:predicted nucleic acid-binding protein
MVIDTDILIDHFHGNVAATAQVTGFELYTRNVRHYPMGDIRVKAPYTRGS